MKGFLWLGLVAALLLLAACAPVPAPQPPVAQPTTVQPTTPVPATEPAATQPPAAAAQAAPVADGWQTYTNTDAGFSVRYPSNWAVKESPPGSTEPIKTDALEGPEGAVYLMWGQGFGGACGAYSAIHLSQGQSYACHTVGDDGLQHWNGMGKALPATMFGARSDTKDAKQESGDLMLAILATLTFGVPADQVTPGAPPPAAAGAEIVIDNLDPAFWPTGNWYILSETFHKEARMSGPDCYQAWPGLEASAEVRPNLLAGAYEVFARWCGDPGSTNQTARGVIEVHRSAGDAAPHSVGVNYQSGVGQWQSLGTYNLEPGAFLDVKSTVNGSVMADAYRFVYKAADAIEVLPTPQPTPGLLVSGNPPSPLQIVTSGDLVARLALVDPYYTSAPMIPTQKTFDDCQAFPRDGCSGTRSGWEVVVAHQAYTLTYRVSDDYKMVAIAGVDMLSPWLAGQEAPQHLFLSGPDGGSGFSVHYSQDNTWHALRYASGSTPASDVRLPAEQGKLLQDLSAKYSTLFLRTETGGNVTFYGLGPMVAPSDADRDALLALVAAISSGSGK